MSERLERDLLNQELLAFAQGRTVGPFATEAAATTKAAASSTDIQEIMVTEKGEEK